MYAPKFSYTAYSKEYEDTLPPADPRDHFPQYAHLQPTNCDDQVESYGITGFLDYEGRLRKHKPIQYHSGNQYSILSTSNVNHNEYGDVRRELNIKNIHEPSHLEYVNSEQEILRNKGKPVPEGDFNLPIPDRKRNDKKNYMPAPAFKYEGDYHYDYNSHQWTVKDLPNVDGYLPDVSKMSWDKRLKHPIYSSNHSASAVCNPKNIAERELDELDPYPSHSVMTSEKYDKMTRKNPKYLNSIRSRGIYRNPNYDPRSLNRYIPSMTSEDKDKFIYERKRRENFNNNYFADMESMTELYGRIPDQAFPNIDNNIVEWGLSYPGEHAIYGNLPPNLSHKPKKENDFNTPFDDAIYDYGSRNYHV